MLQICPVSFDAGTPNLQTIIREAQRLGSLELSAEFTEGFPNYCTLAFVASPKETLSLMVEPENARVIVQHMAGTAPSLNQLIHEILARLGGRHPFQREAVLLPFSSSYVTRYDSKERFSAGVFSLTICAAILVPVLGALCFALAACWVVVRTAIAWSSN
jgi:hypothetical protein